MRRVEHAVHGLAAGDRGDLEVVEDRAAAVVADDHLDARLALARRQQQRADVVQQREVAEHARA